jgi:hypothetical protein
VKNIWLLLGAIIVLGQVMSPALAGPLKTYTYPELSMRAPAALKVKKNNFKNDFPTAGCCYISPQAIAVMVAADKMPDLASMQNSMVKLSGVSLKNWTLSDQATNDKRGWAWRKEYLAFAGDKAVYTFLAHGQKYAYLLMLCADKNEFNANQADYQAWRNSLSVPSSGPDNNR